MQDKAKVRIGRLTSVGMVGVEIGRLYRLARRGDIESIEAYRLASVLSVMAKCLETSEFERRIAEMEAAVAQRAAEPFKPKLVS
jgi:Mn-dependent DtxR family transcriptional regulator